LYAYAYRSRPQITDRDMPKSNSPASKPDTQSPSLVGTARLILPAVGLVWRAAPRAVAQATAIEIALAFSLPLQLWGARWAMDALFSDRQYPIGDYLPTIGVLFGIFAVGRILSAASAGTRFFLPDFIGTTSVEMLSRKVSTLELEVLDQPEIVAKLSRATADVHWRPARTTVDLLQLIGAFLSAVMLVLTLGFLQPMLLLFMPIAVALPLWSTAVGSQAIYRHYLLNAPRTRILNYLSGLCLGLVGALELRAFGLTEHFLERYSAMAYQRINDLRDLSRAWTGRYMAIGLETAGLAVAAVVAGLWLRSEGLISTQTALLATATLYLVAQAADQLGMAVGHFSENAVFVDSFLDILELPGATTHVDPPADDSQGLPSSIAFLAQSVSLEHVCFSYPGMPELVLEDVSMEIRSGEIVALVGENGAGKTTLAKVMLGLYQPQAGIARINGVDIRQLSPAEVRSTFSVVFQDYVRFPFSVAENISLGDGRRTPDRLRIVEASMRSGAHEFVSALPEQYETHVGRLVDDGLELSVGQWQRLALARALYRSASVLILDEPTSALDGLGEREFYATLRSLSERTAILLITHRASTVQMANRVYVLRKGRIVEQGSLPDLTAKDGEYAALFTSQVTRAG